MTSAGPPSTVTVRIDSCTIIGKVQPTSEAYPKPLDIFYGLRFANAERFKAPVIEALGSQPGEIDATKPTPPCPIPFSPNETSEDSLRVNITRPSEARKRKDLPVILYFHGGGFNFGNPLDNNVAAFVSNSEKDVISVSVGYRLGALGFGPGEEGDAVDTNCGLRDQRVAIEWVKKFIGLFGGSDEDVTLMGVSAGAHSVGHHMLNPDPVSFRKVIIESGSPTARSVLSVTHPRTKAQFDSFRRHLPGQKDTRTVDDVLHASLKVWSENMDSLAWPFQPVVDDTVIPDLPLKLWKQPRLPLPTVLTGFCSDEGTDFIPINLPKFRDFWSSLIPNIDLDALEKLYPDPATNPSSPYVVENGQRRRLVDAYGHYAYICPVIHTAHMAASRGARVYLYEYAAFNDQQGERKTAGHCAHAGLVRPELGDIGHCPGQMAISKEMHSRWTNFTSSPDGDLGDQWPVFKSPFNGDGKGELLVFGQGNDEACDGQERGTPVQTRSLTDRELEICRFWFERMELSQGMGQKGVVDRPW